MTKPTSKIRLLTIIIVIAFLSGVAAFYMTTPPSGNPDDKVSGQEDKVSSTSIADSRYASYASGNLKKMVFHKTPKIHKELSFINSAGEMLGLDVFAGNYVVLNFWATWCAPCREEMPSLDALQKHFNGQPLKVVALSTDRGSADKPKKFLKELNITELAFFHDPKSQAARDTGLFGLPTTLLLDMQGREIGRLAGEAVWDAAEVKVFLEALISGDLAMNVEVSKP
jgi:thiol-disulfide isomerase/thioredoxin